MPLIKGNKTLKTDVFITHILTGSGYLSGDVKTDFETLKGMLKDDILPNVLLELTDDDNRTHWIKITDVGMNEAQDTIYMCTFTRDYYLEFTLSSDGVVNRLEKKGLNEV